jgi:hypothetical protein
MVKALHGEPPDEIVLGYHETSVRGDLERACEGLAESPARVVLVNCVGDTAGDALSKLVATQSCEAMTLANGVTALPQTGYFEASRQALTTRPRDLFTTFFTGGDDATLGMPLGGDVASQVLTSRAYGPEIVSLRRETYTDIGAFEPYDTRHGIVHEYVTRAVSAGHDLLVFPEQLMSWETAVAETRAFQEDPTYSYLKAKSLIDDSRLGQRKVLLAALHRAGSPGVSEAFLRGESVEVEQTHWLLPATWNSDDVMAARNRRLVVGLDTDRNELWLYARGPGERRFTVRGGDPEAVDLISSRGEEGSDEYVTVSTFRVPETWESGASYPLIWGVYDGTEKIRSLFLRINKIGPATLVFASRNPVLSARSLRELADGQPLVWPKSTPGGGLADPPVAVEHDETDDYVSQAVAAARRFVRRGRDRDPEQVLRRSRSLLLNPPEVGLLPISPGSGLKAPHRANGWSEGDWLEGWAWDREDRERTLHVVVMRDGEALVMAAADGSEPALSRDVPGRGEHAWRIPVLPGFFEGDRLELRIWEGRTPVYRGGLYVERDGQLMLRRVRDLHGEEPTMTRRRRTMRHWWRR